MQDIFGGMMSFIYKTKKHSDVILSNKKYCNFTEDLFNKKVGYILFFSSILSIISTLIVVNGFISLQNQRVLEIYETCQNLENKIKGVFDSVTEIDLAFNSFKDEVKSTKENFVHIYTSIASIQKDLSVIKNEFHFNEMNNMDNAIKRLNSEKYDFIVSMENLINEGTPFEDFLSSYNEKIEMKKYSTSGELLKFKSIRVKSIFDLKKDMISIGNTLFNLSFEEGFFERQKRIIKEKIINAIKIKKIDDENAEIIEKENLDDKKLYENAVKAISDGDLENALSFLEDIEKINNKDFDSLISDINKRLELNKNFVLFKNEFIEIESKS